LIRSPGYGLTLAAETKNGSVITAESCSMPRNNEGDSITIPEELAKEAVYKLLDEIYKVKEKLKLFSKNSFD
jgi:RNA 3'-terminal phosphate cyclase